MTAIRNGLTAYYQMKDCALNHEAGRTSERNALDQVNDNWVETENSIIVCLMASAVLLSRPALLQLGRAIHRQATTARFDHLNHSFGFSETSLLMRSLLPLYQFGIPKRSCLLAGSCILNSATIVVIVLRSPLTKCDWLLPFLSWVACPGVPLSPMILNTSFSVTTICSYT